MEDITLNGREVAFLLHLMPVLVGEGSFTIDELQNTVIPLHTRLLSVARSRKEDFGHVVEGGYRYIGERKTQNTDPTNQENKLNHENMDFNLSVINTEDDDTTPERPKDEEASLGGEIRGDETEKEAKKKKKKSKQKKKKKTEPSKPVISSDSDENEEAAQNT